MFVCTSNKSEFATIFHLALCELQFRWTTDSKCHTTVCVRLLINWNGVIFHWFVFSLFLFGNSAVLTTVFFPINKLRNNMIYPLEHSAKCNEFWLTNSRVISTTRKSCWRTQERLKRRQRLCSCLFVCFLFSFEKKEGFYLQNSFYLTLNSCRTNTYLKTNTLFSTPVLCP